MTLLIILPRKVKDSTNNVIKESPIRFKSNQLPFFITENTYIRIDLDYFDYGFEYVVYRIIAVNADDFT